MGQLLGAEEGGGEVGEGGEGVGVVGGRRDGDVKVVGGEEGDVGGEEKAGEEGGEVGGMGCAERVEGVYDDEDS